MGSGFGSIVLPVVFVFTLERYGLSGAMLSLGGLWLHALYAPVCAWQMKSPKTDSTDMSLQRRVKLESGDAAHDSVAETGIYSISDGTQINAERKDQQINRKQSRPTVCGKIRNFRYIKFFRIPQVPIILISSLFGFFGYFGGYFIMPLIAAERNLSKQHATYVVIASSVGEMVTKIVV